MLCSISNISPHFLILGFDGPCRVNGIDPAMNHSHLTGTTHGSITTTILEHFFGIFSSLC